MHHVQNPISDHPPPTCSFHSLPLVNKCHFFLPDVQAKNKAVTLDSCSPCSTFNPSANPPGVIFSIYSESDHLSPSSPSSGLLQPSSNWPPCFYLSCQIYLNTTATHIGICHLSVRIPPMICQLPWNKVKAITTSPLW